MLFYDLLNNAKGPVGFDQTVKVPPAVAPAPDLLPVQENTPMPEGIMTVPNNMMTAEQAAALSSFTSGATGFVPTSTLTGPTGFVPRPTLVEERTPYAAPPSMVPTTYMGNVQTPAYTGDTNTVSTPSGDYSVSVDNPSFFSTEVPMVATEYELKGLQPDRTGQNPFARPGPNTVSMQANETIMGDKNPLSQLYYAPQDLK